MPTASCGAPHWEGDTFVNDYEEVINGKRTKIQDLWIDITPNSHTLTEAHDTGNGVMKPYVVSRHATIVERISPGNGTGVRSFMVSSRPYWTSLAQARNQNR